MDDVGSYVPILVLLGGLGLAEHGEHWFVVLVLSFLSFLGSCLFLNIEVTLVLVALILPRCKEYLTSEAPPA